MEYVTDTHPLVWALFAPRRLSQRTLAIFEQTAQGNHSIYIPTVVIAELIMVVEKRRVSATIPQLLAALHALQTASNYHLLPLIAETVIATHALLVIPDIFDRLIVAEAQRLDLALITRDTTIITSGLINVIWE